MNNGDMPIAAIDKRIGVEEVAYYKIGVGRTIKSVDIIARGLTKREHFAGLAMQGYSSYIQQGNESYIAMQCVVMADALLAALEES